MTRTEQWRRGLSTAIAADEEMEREAREPFFVNVERIFQSEIGTNFCRTLDQYYDILYSGGAPELLLQTKGGTVVDAGASAAYALAQLRYEDPNARLIAVDIRNTPLMHYTSTTEYGQLHNVGQMMEDAHIEFIQGSFRRLPELVPEGYDLVVSVGAFPDDLTPASFHIHVLDRLYSGLRRGGHIQVFYAPSQEQLEQTFHWLLHNRLPYQFHPVSPEVTVRNFFGELNGPWGTLTIGPR
jgi:hypothetical protein